MEPLTYIDPFDADQDKPLSPEELDAFQPKTWIEHRLMATIGELEDSLAVAQEKAEALLEEMEEI